jgi:proline iminopeptidase
MNAEPRHLSLQSGNATLAVRFYPNPGRETVILLHGGPGVPDEMTEVREVLQPFMQVVSFDQRGTGPGRHRNCTYSLADYIDDILNIANEFKISRFCIFGHSWGGLYAQLFAAYHPDRVSKIFLCSPASGCGRDIWAMTEREVLAYNRERSTLPEWIGMGWNSLLGAMGCSPAVRRLFLQVIRNYNQGFDVPPPDPEKLRKVNAPPVNRTRREIKKHAPLQPFGETAYPVTITYGDADAYGRSREFVLQRFPFARVVIIPQCGHTPWKHNPTAFSEILKHFFSKS